MKRYKFFTNFEEEENWLNLMANQGYRFTNKTMLAYEFQPESPENTIIKIDYRSFQKREDFQDYCALFEDSGWQHIAGTKSSGYQYFRKIDNKGSDEIFSDIDSRASRYKRLSDMWFTLCCSFIPIFAVIISTNAIDPGVLLDPKSLYYTPGLWDLIGLDFWRAFLFETPFALFRGTMWLFLPITILFYLYFGWKANKRYRMTKEDIEN